MDRHYDIAIAGGGIAGLTFANALAKHCLTQQCKMPKVVLIDAGADLRSLLESKETAEKTSDSKVSTSSLEAYDKRVVALTQLSYDFLDQQGVLAHLPSSLYADFNAMHVWDAKGTATIDFDLAQTDQARLGIVVENRLLCAAMQACLLAANQVELLTHACVEQFNPQASSQKASLVLANGDRIVADIVVAADGARSFVRESVGFETRTWDYGQNAIVCTVRTAEPHQKTAWQRFTAYGPLAFLPVSAHAESEQSECSEHLCSIVWSQTRERAEQLMALNHEQFKLELEGAIEGRLGEILDISAPVSFPLHQRHAKDYYQHGVVLIGDAAHSIHPLAGQGINLGIKDAEALAIQLVDDLVRQRPLGSPQALGRYNRARKLDNLTTMSVMEAFKHLYSPVPPFMIALRNFGMSAVNKQAWLKRLIVQHMMGRAIKHQS